MLTLAIWQSAQQSFGNKLEQEKGVAISSTQHLLVSEVANEPSLKL
jgi:hypothetical protein